jgi:hypothetical protein
MGERARETAVERFGIARFARDWDAVLREAVGGRAAADARQEVTTAGTT